VRLLCHFLTYAMVSSEKRLTVSVLRRDWQYRFRVASVSSDCRLLRAGFWVRGSVMWMTLFIIWLQGSKKLKGFITSWTVSIRSSSLLWRWKELAIFTSQILVLADRGCPSQNIYCDFTPTNFYPNCSSPCVLASA
jgi:hypothetical protein